MPAPTFNQSTASAASGDIIISLTPTAANNLEIVATSAWQTSTTPSGWAHPTNAFFWQTSPNTSLLTFDTSSPDPIPQWAALMLDLPTLTTPALEQKNLISYGLFPYAHPYTYTFSGVNQLNAGDCIIWCLALNSVSAPTGLSVNDSQGNNYQIFQFTQIISGVYVTTLLAIAFGASAGICVTNFDITAPAVGGQSFALDLFTFSGVSVPPPPVPPITPVVLNFQDPSGAPLANGTVQLRLTQDASSQFASGPQIAAGRFITVKLDSTGTATVGLRPTEGLSPSVVYQVQAFTAQGLPCWRGLVPVLST